MKNKEIEEILNYMKQYVKNKYEHDSEPMLNYKDLQIILSYIEQLQSNWNSLREWLEKGKEDTLSAGIIYGIVLDKMNELERGDKN